MKRKIAVNAALIAAGAVVIWGLGFFIQTWTMLDLEKITAQPQSTVIYDGDGAQAYIISGSQDRTRVPLGEIPTHVVNAFLAAEDARFYSHRGIDIYRVGGAIIGNIKSGGYSQGASTITQQLVKLTHLSSDKTIERKLREAVLALRLETAMSKNDILEAYLNTVYFGGGAYGIDAAARRYFGVGAGELTLSQGAILAGVIKAPSVYAPHINYNKSIGRRDMILSAMAEYGYITDAQADEARAQTEQIAPGREESSFVWYAESAGGEAARLLGISYDDLLRGGYSLHTALDASMQKSAENLFADAENFPQSSASKGPVQSALVALDADSGEVLSLIGGRSREVARGLNRATDMKRQPGSAFKPISVYAAAVDRYGFMPTSFVDDEKREYEKGYSPGNVTGAYYGTVTLRQALSRSLNAAAVDLISRTGVSAARDYAERAGIALSDDDVSLSLALGSLTEGVSPVTLAAAYAPLANGGNAVSAHLIRRIEDANGETVYEYGENSRTVMSAASSRLLTDMLITAATSGTAKALSGLAFAVAGKTGTVGEGSVGNRDVWNVAYTPKAICCVWMGYDEADAAHCLPNSVTGSNYPTRLAAKFIGQNADGFDGGDFKTPEELVWVPIDLKALNEKHKVMLVSGLTPKSHAVNELFLRSDAPVAVSDVWVAPSKVFDLYVSRRDASYVDIRFTSVDSWAVYQVFRVGAEGDELIAEESLPAGERVNVEYETRDAKPGFYVVGLDKTLYEEGIRLAGEASEICFEAKNLDWFYQSGEEAEITEEAPLFGD